MPADDEKSSIQLVESFMVRRDLLNIQSGDRYSVPLAVDLSRIQQIARDREARIMLVIRDRSLTDNTLNVLISARSEEGGNVAFADLSFFDPPNSAAADFITSSEQPLGFFFLDVTDEIDQLVKGVGESEGNLSLDVAVLPVHGKADRSKIFSIGRVSLDVVLLEK